MGRHPNVTGQENPVFYKDATKLRYPVNDRSRDVSRDSIGQTEPRKVSITHVSAKSIAESPESYQAVRAHSKAGSGKTQDRPDNPNSNRDSTLEQEPSALFEDFFSAKPQNSKVTSKLKVFKPKMFIQSNRLFTQSFPAPIEREL